MGNFWQRLHSGFHNRDVRVLMVGKYFGDLYSGLGILFSRAGIAYNSSF